MKGNRLVRMVMLEAMGLKGKVKWIEKLKQSLEEIGWIDECWDGGTGKAVKW